MNKLPRELARLVKTVRLVVLPDWTPAADRAGVERWFLEACRNEFPTLQSASVKYRPGAGNRGFVELAGELTDRRPEEEMQTAVLLRAFDLFLWAVERNLKSKDQRS